MKVLLTLVIMMLISGCKVSYQKSHVTEGDIATGMGITLNAKVCLESAFDNDVAGVEMITTLYLPETTPYFISPWWHSSYNDYSITSDMIDPDGIIATTIDRVFVDWVLVQIYKDINGVMTFMDSQSGLIHFNGTIYDTSGYPGIVFPDLAAGNYYVNIVHRNHLSIGSDEPVAITSSFEASTYNIDFTKLDTTYLDPNPLDADDPFVALGTFGGGNETKCMKAGDLNGDRAIDALDEAVIWNNILELVDVPAVDTAVLGYRNSDVNFDGKSQNVIPDVIPMLFTPSPDLSLIQGNNPSVGSLHGYP
jgi:hypothetical protein